MTKRKFIFDVDGVLCDRGQLINQEFERWMHLWLSDKEYYLVTGSPRDKVINQIGMSVATNPKVGFHCLGNSLWIDNREHCINEVNLTPEEEMFFIDFFHRSKYHKKATFDQTNNLVDRKGSISYSTILRNSTIEERQEYKVFDDTYKERENLIIQLADAFPRLEAYIGGDTSVDVVLRGANKGQILNYIARDENEELHFFGDRFEKYGIDSPLARLLDGPNPGFRSFVHHITSGYKETWDILKELG